MKRKVSRKVYRKRRVSSKRNTRRRYRGGGENIKVYDTFPFLMDEDEIDEIKDEDMYIKVGKDYYQGNYVHSVLLKNFITCFNSQENMLPEEYQDIKGLLNIRELIKDLNFPIEEGALNSALESRSKNPITEEQIIAKIKRKVEGVGDPYPFDLYEFKYLLDILGFEEKKGLEVKKAIPGDSGEVGATQQMTDPPRVYGFSLGTPEEVADFTNDFIERMNVLKGPLRDQRIALNLQPDMLARVAEEDKSLMAAEANDTLSNAWDRMHRPPSDKKAKGIIVEEAEERLRRLRDLHATAAEGRRDA